MDLSLVYEVQESLNPALLALYSACGVFMTVAGILAMWKVFQKAGEPGWAAIVPIYNTYVLFKITWGSGWFFLLLLIPIVNIVILIITYVKMARVFGRSGGFAVGLIFLNLIFMLILAFGDAQYIGIIRNGGR